jgi:RHS repeat-associated protein
VAGVASGNGDHFAEALGYQGSYTGDPDSVGSKLSTYPGSTELVSYDKIGRLARWHRREAGADTTGDEIYRYDRAGNVLYGKLGSTTAGFYHTYHPGTNRLKRITTNPQDTVTAYQWYANGHLQIEPTRVFQTDYRNLNNFIQINKYPPDPWTNSLTFVYDADRLRVKKVYNRGYYCACDPDPAAINLGDDSLIVDRSGAKTSGTPDQPVSKAAGPASGMTPAAAPPGDCVCRDLTTTLYLYTYDGRLVREYLNNAAQRDYLYAGGQRIGVSEKIGTTFRLHYFVTDHLGSTRSCVGSTGLVKSTYNYYPYGAARTSTVTTDTKHRYTGKELDDEDIRQYYYGARYLNGVTQCFNSVDPAQSKYPGWSPYCYALANPVRNLDTEGEWVETALDVVSLGLSYRDFRNNPSWGNAGWLFLDAAAAVLPLIPAVGIVRHAGKIDDALDLVRGVEKTAEAGKVADRTVDVAKTAERVEEASGAVKTVPSGEAAVKPPHGNTADNRPAVLYEKYDAKGNFQKHGVSANPDKRYTRTEVGGGKLKRVEEGKRKEMLKKERERVEKHPGPDNREPWAGRAREDP